MELCSCIEKCFFHGRNLPLKGNQVIDHIGIKVKEFYGTFPFWGLLERLEASVPPILPVRNSVGAVACMTSLRSPIGKARGWIRQALNTQCLEIMIASLVKQHTKLLSFFYYEDALLNQITESNVLLAILRSFKVYQFNFSVDVVSLNMCPDWLLVQIEKSSSPTVVAQPVRRGSQKSSSSTSSSLFSDTFFSSLEKGLDMVMSTVDNVATQTVKYLNDSANEALISPSSPSSVQRRVATQSANSRIPLNSSRPRPPLFGTSLKVLLLDERRCVHTFLDYRIGIPNQIKLLLDELSRNIEVAGLFRHRASVSQIESLRRSLEEERGIPQDTSIHAIAQCFLQWCYELPEPLLGYELYSPIQSCQEIEDENDRYRNISLLLDAVSWWNQPLLFQVVKLLHILTRPGAMELNSLNIIAVSIFATPFLLRSPQLGPIYGRGMSIEDIDRLHMTAVASGSVITQILVENQPIIFQHMAKYMQELQIALVAKCERLRHLQVESLQYLIVHPQEKRKVSELSPDELVNDRGTDQVEIDNHEADYGINELYDSSDLTIAREREIYSAMYTLWEDLRPTHSRLAEFQKVKESETQETLSSIIPRVEISLSDLDDVPDERDPVKSPREVNKELAEWENSVPATTTRLLKLMKSKRWEVCFPVENALFEFNSQPGGMLAIKCFSQWLKRFGDKASLIICEFALKRKELCSLPIVCVYLIQICLVSLKLVTPQSLTQVMSSKHPSQLNIEHRKIRAIAREECWTILSDDSCLEQLFSISLLTFDDLWKHMAPSSDYQNSPTAAVVAASLPPSGANSATPLTRAINSTPRSGWLGFPQSTLKDHQIELSKDLLAACMTGCRVLLDELLYVNQVLTVEQLWKVWAEQRLLRQQIIVEAQLHRAKQQKIEKEIHLKQNQQNIMNEEIEREETRLMEKEVKKQTSCQITEYSEESDHYRYHQHLPSTTLAKKPTLMKLYGGVQSYIYGNHEDMILSIREMEVLEDNLPLYLQCCDWDLKYSLARDGASLETLVRLSRGCRRTILVIEDTYGCHFGVIISDDPWVFAGDKYYGSGTCRVFSFHNTIPNPNSLSPMTVPSSSSHPPSPPYILSPNDPSKTFHIYETTMKNYYFMLTSQDMLGVGGGGGGFALLLDGDLNHGTSNPNCETFDSPILSTESEFLCARCNVYSIHRSDGSDDIDVKRRGGGGGVAGGGGGRGGGGGIDQKSLFKIEME